MDITLVDGDVGACDLLRDQCIVDCPLHRPPAVDASDAEDGLVAFLRQFERDRDGEDVLLATVRVDDDIPVQLGH